MTQKCDINILYFLGPAWYFQLSHVSKWNGRQNIMGFSLDTYYFHYFVTAADFIFMNAIKHDKWASGWCLPVRQGCNSMGQNGRRYGEAEEQAN